MELITYIENHTSIHLPQFQHQSKNVVPESAQQDTKNFYSTDVTIPYKIIMKQNNDLFEVCMGSITCYLLFGFQFQVKDWQQILSLYSDHTAKIKLYRGNTVEEIPTEFFTKRQQSKINQPETSITTKSKKFSQSCSQIYVVQLIKLSESQFSKIICYLPSVFSSMNLSDSLQITNANYFNNKVLQILSEYVSLENNISCFKDLFHHDFQSTLYTGKVTSFQIFIKIVEQSNNIEVAQSFINKLSQITIPEKHLLQQFEHFSFIDMKKQIDQMITEQKKITKNLAVEKEKIVQEINNVLLFLNLKSAYPNKLVYEAITPQMLKKIRNQNIDIKAKWIKQQRMIMNGLDGRLVNLRKTKSKLKDTLLTQSKANYSQVQQIRKQIQRLQINIKNCQVDKQKKIFNETNFSMNKNIQINKNSLNKNKKVYQEKNDQTSHNILVNFDEAEREKLLKYEMVKAQFEIEKQFANRKAEYTKITEQLVHYFKDY